MPYDSVEVRTVAQFSKAAFEGITLQEACLHDRKIGLNSLAVKRICCAAAAISECKLAISALGSS